MGYPVICGNADCGRDAYVIKHENETFWLGVRRFFENIETKWSVLRFIRWPSGHEDEWVVLRTVLALITALVLNTWTNPCLYVILGAFLIQGIVELTLVQVSVAFVSRWQRDPLRTVVLWLLNYIQVIIAFGCFYWMLPSTQFQAPVSGLASVWDGIYLSAVVITTLGDSRYSPLAYTSKLLVVVEVGLGLMLVAMILAVLITSVGQLPPPKRHLTSEQLLALSARKDRGDI
jgi:hypothetical protein